MTLHQNIEISDDKIVLTYTIRRPKSGVLKIGKDKISFDDYVKLWKENRHKFRIDISMTGD